MLREAKIEDSVNLKYVRMSNKEYSLKFHQLLRYAPNFMVDILSKIRKFITGLNRDLIL